MSTPIYGIDLGTTNSLLARVRDGQPEVVCDGDGQPISLPSAVSFLDDHQVVVGSAALERAAIAPGRTVLSVKRLMGQGLEDLSPAIQRHFSVGLVEEGRKLVKVDIGDRRLTPQEVSSHVLRELKRRGEAGVGEAIERVVITVPAYFDDAQRQATRDAGKMAGLQVVRIINEPTAASLAYGLGGKNAEGVIAVYDLGGGTFDLSLLRVQAGTFRVLATSGDTLLGGDDVDAILVESALAALSERGLATDDASPQSHSPRLRAQLRSAAEAAKIALSGSETAIMKVQDPTHGINLEIELTRDELNKAIEPMLHKTLGLCDRALASAGLRAKDVDEVVLVGGSTRIPFVRQRVGEHFGRTPHTELNPDEVVALGAAVQADILTGTSEANVLLMDVTPLSLGIETYMGGVNKLIMSNTAIPAQASETFTTPQDNVTGIDLHVLQGERELARDCRSLARFKLKVPPMPAGYPKVKVTFLIDADGILRVLAFEERSGAETEIEVTPVHGLTEDEVDDIIGESIDHAIEDVKLHQLIDLRNESATVLRAARRELGRAGDGLTPEQHAAIQAGIDALDALASKEDDQGQDNNALKAALDHLNKVSGPLAQVVLDRALQKTVEGQSVDQIEVK